MNTDALQAVALGLSTFVQEDAPTIGAALLSSAGKLDWRLASAACFAGIWIGDALLYLLARGAGRPLLATRFAQRFVKEESLVRGEAWFASRGTWALVLSRFVPGLRLPTYLAAGFLQVPFAKFLFVTGAAVFVWTASLFIAVHWLGGKVQAVTQHSAGALIMAGSALFVGLVTWRKGARVRLNPATSSDLRFSKASPMMEPKQPRGLARERVRVWFARWTRWEFWPAWLFYIPVAVNYLRLAIRYRGLTLPTAANPGIFSGGVVGESKIATLCELQATSPEFTAEAHLIDRGISAERLGALHRAAATHGIQFPFILKPDVGQRGVGVKLIRDTQQASTYLSHTDAPLVCQRYAPGPLEAGIFFHRFPHETRGHIFAITEKIFPTVTGNGVSTIEELIWNDGRARFVAEKYLRRVGDRRSEVLRAGEMLKLVEAGNHAQGCIFRDGMHLWSEELEIRIDAISQKLSGFFIGRYDIRYASEKDLRGGRNFQIIELNGAASEATSIYDARNSLWTAYRTLFRQWELVFAIGAANREHGASTMTLASLWRVWRRTVALIGQYPLAD